MSKLAWALGLKNHVSGKYLTQETFGYALNSNGASLKKKQTFYLETTADGLVHLKTHLNRYVYGTQAGEFKADAEAPSAATAITIEPQVDGTWAIKTSFGFYIHGTGDHLSAFTKDLPADGKWVVRLAMHPQVNIMNVMRKRFVHLQNGELVCNEDIPWGPDALVTFYFFEDHPDGRYGLVASNGSFLTASGRLSKTATPDTQFMLGFHDDQISLRDASGAYLAAVGGAGTLKVNKTKVGKDELFVIQDSQPQFIITASSGKKISIKSNIELKADQVEVTHLERFQLEVADNGKVAFKTNKGMYWAPGPDGTVGAVSTKKGTHEHFTVVYKNDKVALQASSGKFLAVKPNGGIKADANVDDETAQFVMEIINRPQIVFRGQYGFIGLKGASGRLEVSRAQGEIFDLECDKGKYYLKSGGRYWGVDADGVHATSGTKVAFYFEFPQRSRMLIKTEHGVYLEGEQNGAFKATGKSANINTLWEF